MLNCWRQAASIAGSGTTRLTSRTRQPIRPIATATMTTRTQGDRRKALSSVVQAFNTRVKSDGLAKRRSIHYLNREPFPFRLNRSGGSLLVLTRFLLANRYPPRYPSAGQAFAGKRSSTAAPPELADSPSGRGCSSDLLRSSFRL